jgi:hypothetical protein
MSYTPQQLEELKIICKSDASLGPFSGMIYNQIVHLPSSLTTEALIESKVKLALDVRLAIRNATTIVSFPQGTQ